MMKQDENRTPALTSPTSSTSSTSTPLDETRLAELTRDLEALAERLRQGLAGSAASARPVELDQPAVGRVSRIDAIQQQKMLEANRHAQRSRLQLVQTALRRLEDDTYGECLACGESIAWARLVARPETPFCLECQSARERA